MEPIDDHDTLTPAPDPLAGETRRRRGRPRQTDEPLGAVSVWIPPRVHDRIIALAKSRRQTVSEYLRDVLVTMLGRH